jgi:site-specific recombinase XerD
MENNIIVNDSLLTQKSNFYCCPSPDEFIEYFHKNIRNTEKYIAENKIDPTRAFILLFLKKISFKHGSDVTERIMKGTINRYADYLCRFFCFAQTHPQNIYPSIVQDYIGSLRAQNLSINSINLHISILKSFFTYLVNMGFMARNPTASITVLKNPKRGHEHHVLSCDELQMLLSNIKRESMRDYLLFSVLRFSGVRCEEVANLKWSGLIKNLYGDFFLNVLGKGSKERIVPIPKGLAESLLEYKAETIPFADETLLENYPMFGCKHRIMQPLDPNSIYKMLKKYAQKYIGRKDVSPHWFRHSFATHAKMAGVKTSVIQRILGHSSPATTMIYEHSFHYQSDPGLEIFESEFRKI